MQLGTLQGSYLDLPSLLGDTIRVTIAGVAGFSIGAYFGLRNAFRNLYNPDYSQASAVDRFAYIDMQLPYEQAFDRCLDSLRTLSKSTVLLEDRLNGRIEVAVMPASWWGFWRSWGQRVSFRLGSDQEGSTKILITSCSTMPGGIGATTTSINKRNIDAIIAFLREEAGTQIPLAASIAPND